MFAAVVVDSLVVVVTAWGGGSGCGCEKPEACCVTAVRACNIKGSGWDSWL